MLGMWDRQAKFRTYPCCFCLLCTSLKLKQNFKKNLDMLGQSHILGVLGNSNCIVTHMQAKRAVCKKLFYFVSWSLLLFGFLFYIKINVLPTYSRVLLTCENYLLLMLSEILKFIFIPVFFVNFIFTSLFFIYLNIFPVPNVY